MTLPLSLLAVHFVADFILQSDWMAINKSKSWKALLCHVTVYSLCFLPFGMLFAGITFLSHYITDDITSRITSKLWFLTPVPTGEVILRKDAPWYSGGVRSKRAAFADTYFIDQTGNRHWFFVVIGFDQLIHAVTLALTYNYLQ